MTIATRATPACTVTLTRDGPHAYFTDLPERLVEQLTAPEWRPVPAPLGGVRAEIHRRPLLRRVHAAQYGSDVYVCAAGLAEVVVRHLERAGVSVKIRGYWLGALPTPNYSLAGRVGIDTRLITAMERCSHLLVRHGPGVCIDNVAAMIALAWPTCRVAIAVARIEEARDLAAALQWPGVPASLASHRIGGDRPRVVVATFGQMGSLDVALDKLDVLLLPDAVEALGVRSRDILVPNYWAGNVLIPRVVGCVQAGQRLAPADRIGLIEICGPYIYELPEIGMVVRPVTVVMTTVEGGSVSALGGGQKVSARRLCSSVSAAAGEKVSARRLCSSVSAPGSGQKVSARRLSDLLRVGVWRHPVRNRRLARLGRLLVSDDRTALTAAFPAVAAVKSLALPATVIIVVQGPDQAGVLSEYLPDWPLFGGPDGKTGLPGHYRPQLRQIVTLDSLREMSYLDADVIVRADGGTGALPLSLAALHAPYWMPPRPLLVVDCDDRHHPELRRRSRSRRAAYRQVGWPQAGQDQVDLALDDILHPVRA